MPNLLALTPLTTTDGTFEVRWWDDATVELARPGQKPVAVWDLVNYQRGVPAIANRNKTEFAAAQRTDLDVTAVTLNAVEALAIPVPSPAIGTATIAQVVLVRSTRERDRWYPTAKATARAAGAT